MPKRRIKNLTYGERLEICRNNKECEKCPLLYDDRFFSRSICFGDKDLFDFLNKKIEIEVETDDN